MKEEKETVYDEAIETAKDIEVVENVMIQTATTQLSFSSLMFGLERGDYVIPDFQRMYHWTEEQAEQLAISLVRGMPIPPIYGYRNAEQQVVILNGQQRVLSLYFYYIGRFFADTQQNVFDYRELDIDHTSNFEEALAKKYDIVPTKFYMIFGKEKCDITYATLPKDIKRKVDYTTISVVEIKTSMIDNPEATLHKIFTNLNNGGTRLSDQEMRNGVYPCKFSKMIDAINRNDLKWRKLYGHMSDKYDDMEKLYRFCAMKKFVKYDGMDFQIKGDSGTIKEFIDVFTEQAFYFTSEEVEEYQESLEKFFCRLDISRENFNKVLITEGIFVVLEKTHINVLITDEIYNDISEDAGIKSTMNARTFSRTNMNKRWKMIYDLLSGYGQ